VEEEVEDLGDHQQHLIQVDLEDQVVEVEIVEQVEQEILLQ
jgi:hypothetical protein